jgi:hypothetical protein
LMFAMMAAAKNQPHSVPYIHNTEQSINMDWSKPDLEFLFR